MFVILTLMIIGIAGGSRSGKTTLSRVLAKELDCRLLSLDDYFFAPSTFPRTFERPDYDRIEAIDWDRALGDIASHKGNLIVEGFLLLAHAGARALMDMTFFVDLDEAERMRRRFAQQPDMARDYVQQHILKRHNELVEPSKAHADVVLDGRMDTDVLAAQVLAEKAFWSFSPKVPRLQPALAA